MTNGAETSESPKALGDDLASAPGALETSVASVEDGATSGEPIGVACDLGASDPIVSEFNPPSVPDAADVAFVPSEAPASDDPPVRGALAEAPSAEQAGSTAAPDSAAASRLADTGDDLEVAVSDAALALAQPVALGATPPIELGAAPAVARGAAPGLAADLEGPALAEPSRRPSSTLGPDPRIGETLNGRYRLDKLIGKGGMGRVYRATQFPLNRPVALKILSPEFQKKDPQFVRRFYLEAATAARLSHPNTITVFDYGESERGELFIVMEYLRGRPLSRVISADGPFPPERALHVTTQICRALREAHAKGIVHRDLKPGNIMLLEEGDDVDYVKVLDFGLVKVIAGSEDDSDAVLDPVVPEVAEADLTRAGMFLGSPKYMSPEQIKGGSLDVRTDIYSLGVLLFHMCAGRPPYTGASSVEIVYKHVHEPIPRVRDLAPHVDPPPELEEIIRRCLAKDRRARFATMGDLLLALKAVHRSIAGASVGLDTGVSMADVSSIAHTLDLESASLLSAPGSSGIRPVPRLPSTSQGLREVAPIAGEARERPSVELHFTEIDDTTPAAPSRATSTDSAPPQRPSLVPPILAGAALVLVLGLGAFVWLRRAEPVSIPPLAEAPPLAAARVSFRSTPPGAEVFEGGRLLGTTPFEWRFALGEGEPSSRRFIFRLAGHLESPLEARLAPGASELHVELRTDAPPAGESDALSDPSYKDNPY